MTATTTPQDRKARAASITASLDAAASLINSQHAAVLASVIAMKDERLIRDVEGFSAIRDWIISKFDFTYPTASAIAAIARLSGKFRLLATAATTGAARVDQVAFAVRQLDQTPAMRLFARTPFRAPVPSPFNPEVLCATPEAMVSEYCAHASFKDLKRHLDELWAAIAEEVELFDSLGEQSMQRLELTALDNGMWSLHGDLSDTTGRLLDKYLKTACPPPRQEDQDTDGILPPQANRNAEALHQLLAGYGSSREAATRHGHTATLDLVVDIETLQGKDTGRLPLLEGEPISVAMARLLACETRAIPSVFNYQTGEAIELGRALRLPNVALRRKLELEQPEGCAWDGCDRPVAWTEAHHITHWVDGGETNAENLILLCRFHHGRIHTAGWTVEKTGPGQAIITHHDHADTTRAPGDSAGCGCSDWRTDADMDAENSGSDWDVFPTGLYRSEWSEGLKPDLDGLAEAIDRDRSLAAIKAAKAKCRERFGTKQPKETEPVAKVPAPSTPVQARAVDYGDPPFLGCPSGRLLGEAPQHQAAQPEPTRGRALQHAQGRTPPHGPTPTPTESRRTRPDPPLTSCRCPV